jgi:DNA polymerase IV
MAVANLESDPPVQQLLPLERIRAEQLDAVLDALCERYGSKAVTRAVLVNQRGRDVLPILPD